MDSVGARKRGDKKKNEKKGESPDISVFAAGRLGHTRTLGGCSDRKVVSPRSRGATSLACLAGGPLFLSVCGCSSCAEEPLWVASGNWLAKFNSGGRWGVKGP